MSLTGGTVYDVYNHRTLTWKPAGPVVDEWTFYTRSSTDGYTCLGVIGDSHHMSVKDGGDHTPRSTHCTTVDGKNVCPKAGWVYAIDGRVPDMAKFETWLLSQLRTGKYNHLLKYFNINNRHWNRMTGWKTVVYSADAHLHLSFIPGAEYADSSILADYEHYRTATTPPPATAWPSDIIWSLPTLTRGATGQTVKVLQGLLHANGHTESGIDGDFGPATDNSVRAFQTAKKIGVDGIAGRQTYTALLGSLPTLKRGATGQPVKVLQGLLHANGRTESGIDGDFGTATDKGVQAFQTSKKLTVDGIAGQQTYTALLKS
jgi:hypothetical protein